jgi:hypothetical protein
MCMKTEINYCVLRSLFPTWNGKGIERFVIHYNKYEFMRMSTAEEPKEQDQFNKDLISEVHYLNTHVHVHEDTLVYTCMYSH